MNIWEYLALILLGISLGLCLAFKLKGPEIEIRQQIKKLKQRGRNNSQQLEMNIVPDIKKKKGFFSFLKRDPEKKAARQLRKAKRKFPEHRDPPPPPVRK